MKTLRTTLAFLMAAAAAPAWAGPTLHFASKDGVASMPFVLDNHHIYVDVQMADGKPASFLVDTGADFTVLNARFANAAGMASSGSSSVHAAGGDVAMSNAPAQVVRLPGLEVEDHNVVVMDLSHLEPISGRRIDGVLGNDILSEGAVRIDYAAREITFYRPGAYQPPQGAAALSLSGTHFSQAVYVPVTLTLPGHRPEEISFAIDSGASHSSLNTPYVDSSGAIQAVGKTVERQAYGAGSEKIQSLSGRASALQLGPYLLLAPVVELMRVKDGVFAKSSFQGALGNDVLERFTVTLDYPDMKLVLEPNAQIKTPFRADASGLTLFATGEDFRSYTIDTAAPGTPAADAGLQHGDIIEQVDAAPASRMSLGDLRLLLTQDGKSLRLTVRRGAQDMDVTLKLRKLL